MLAVFKRELRSYFTGVVGYVFLVMFLVVAAAVFCYSTLFAMSADVTTYFSVMLLFSAIILPLLTMKSFSEERKLKTEQLVLTSPVSLTGMVMGKYLAAFTMFLSTVLISCINFIPLYAIAAEERAAVAETANPVIGPVTAEIIGSLIGIILLGAAFIAIGIFISSLTESQLSAAVITIGVILLMVILSLVNQIGSDADGTRLISNYAVRFVIDWISVFSRFGNFTYGIFDFSALIYYLSIAGVFIFLTVRIYEKRRWG
jgi:ABC-2 type transport system permease protein